MYGSLATVSEEETVQVRGSSDTTEYDDLPTVIPTYHYTYLQSYVHTYLPTAIPTYRFTYLQSYLHTYPPTYLPRYVLCIGFDKRYRFIWIGISVDLGQRQNFATIFLLSKSEAIFQVSFVLVYVGYKPV